jgi:hypothetical protein
MRISDCGLESICSSNPQSAIHNPKSVRGWLTHPGFTKLGAKWVEVTKTVFQLGNSHDGLVMRGLIENAASNTRFLTQPDMTDPLEQPLTDRKSCFLE